MVLLDLRRHMHWRNHHLPPGELLDTAGRHQIDDYLMHELERIKEAIAKGEYTPTID